MQAQSGYVDLENLIKGLFANLPSQEEADELDKWFHGASTVIADCLLTLNFEALRCVENHLLETIKYQHDPFTRGRFAGMLDLLYSANARHEWSQTL